MRIRVLSSKLLSKYKEKASHLVIVVTCPGFSPVIPEQPSRLGTLHLEFDDIRSLRHKGRAFNADDASRIFAFLAAYGKRSEVVIVSCSGGISRSAGIAVGIAAFYGLDAAPYSRYPFKPNTLVVRVMSDYVRNSRSS